MEFKKVSHVKGAATRCLAVLLAESVMSSVNRRMSTGGVRNRFHALMYCTDDLGITLLRYVLDEMRIKRTYNDLINIIDQSLVFVGIIDQNILGMHNSLGELKGLLVYLTNYNAGFYPVFKRRADEVLKANLSDLERSVMFREQLMLRKQCSLQLSGSAKFTWNHNGRMKIDPESLRTLLEERFHTSWTN